MSLLSRLASLALRPCLSAIGLAAEAAGCSFAKSGVDVVEKYLLSRFTDQSQELQKALGRSADRAWVCLEVALGGESLLGFFTRRGEDKALSKQVRAFLDADPLQLPPAQGERLRRQALAQLQTARKSKLIPGVEEAHSLAKQLAEFTHYSDPSAVYDAEWRVLADVADELRRAGYDALAEVVALRPDSGQLPLLTVAVRFCFRSEVEGDDRLFRGLMHEQVDRLRHDLVARFDGMRHELSAGFGELLVVLQQNRQIIESGLTELLAVAEETRDRVAEVQADIRRVNEKLDRLLDREIRPDDSMSIRNESERRLVREVVAKYRSLSEAERSQAPELLKAVARLENAAGEYSDALHDFQQRAALPGDNAEKAEAHYGAYLAALEGHHWETALSELQEAARLAPEQYAPFPLNKYIPERILGAGGFGVVILCRDVDSGGRVAVKALRTDELDRDAATVLAEAEQLEALEHENIIRLRTAGFADAARTRPYLVMSFFEGTTLDEHVQKNGPLSPKETREVAGQIAAGLQAAHYRNILHRDVKPGNVMGRKVDGRWQVKLIDFGLALRRRTVQHTMSNAEALQSTTRGKSIAGTLDYAAPEQMGKLKGATVGPHSDVFGFGRTICFLLFKNPQPGPEEWEQLTDTVLKKLLGGCLKREPTDRLKTFAEVRRLLLGPAPAPAPPAPTAAQSATVPAPLVLPVEAIPAPQVPPSDLPPLPKDMLALEGRLNGLRQAIEQIEQGRHPDLRPVWKALEDSKTPAGQPLIDALKQEIEQSPSCRDSELCALNTNVNQSAVLVVINAFKRLVELRKERAEVEQQLAKQQEEDFRGILARFLVHSDVEQFPLAVWMKLEPLLVVRRYMFVGNARELLQKAEEHFAAIRAEREAERLRLRREQETIRQQQQAERERREEQVRVEERRRLEQKAMQEKEAKRRQEAKERRLANIKHNIASAGAGSVIGGLALGGAGAAVGAVGWTSIVAFIVLSLLSWFVSVILCVLLCEFLKGLTINGSRIGWLHDKKYRNKVIFIFSCLLGIAGAVSIMCMRDDFLPGEWFERLRVCSINRVLRIIEYETQAVSERFDRRAMGVAPAFAPAS